MNNSKHKKFVGWVGIIAVIFGLSAIFASTLLCGVGCGNPIPIPFNETNEWASDGSFSWKSNALSDIGISKIANIFNSSIIILGILTLIFYIGFIQTYAKSKLFYLGGILLILSGISFSLGGVFTEAYATLHTILVIINIGSGPIGLVLVGLAFILMNIRNKGFVSILVGIANLLVILIPWYNWLDLGVAVPEIVMVTIASIWIVWMSVGLIRHK
jgi:hypothetical membrane protein